VAVVVWPLLQTCYRSYLWQPVNKSRTTLEAWDKRHQTWLSDFNCNLVFSA